MQNRAPVANAIEDDDVAAAFLYHDCDQATLAWALATRRAFLPRAVYHEHIELALDIPSTYIAAAEDRTIRPEWQRRIARERPRVEPIEIAAGHCPNVSQPACQAANRMVQPFAVCCSRVQ